MRNGFLRRLSFFLLGLAIGTFILKFFLQKKNVNFDYLPNARTLKSIRNIQPLSYSVNAKTFMIDNQIDTLTINQILSTGKVDFSRSKTHTNPCKTYLILPPNNTTQIALTVTRCDSTATVEKIEILD